ncbi:MAG: hypothetical protein O2782_04415, partial [bacterium]|nr:hypothetical protein [bacterium]
MAGTDAPSLTIKARARAKGHKVLSKRAMLFVLIAVLSAAAVFGQTDPCDTNFDGIVDAFELGQCGGAPAADPCDTNLDGVVDAFELGQCGGDPADPGAQVPSYDE